MSGVALDKCTLISIFVESVLWGLFVSLYMITIFLLLQKKSNFHKHIPHLVLVTLLFVLCTLHVGLSFARVGNAFFNSPPHPVQYLENMTDTLFRFKYGVLFVEIFIGDLLIVSRSFMLWNKKFVVAIGPTLMAIGTLVAAGGALQSMSSAADAKSVQMWITASYTLALATKTACFLLVAFRVRQIHSLMTANINRHVIVYTALIVLVESGAASLLTAIILLPTFVSGDNAHNIVCDALSPITGITVTTIVAGMTINLSSSTSATTASRPAWNRHSVPRTPISPIKTKKGRWNDYDDDAETPPMTPSPVMSRPESMHHVNQSTGTLNMGIVI
ncbi:hypothetical protein K439DRAFT_1629199 [Ramaria rubella]|nr:hypothetical protein K439DRAFT_1629199 [Ramaria rubella]